MSSRRGALLFAAAAVLLGACRDQDEALGPGRSDGTRADSGAAPDASPALDAGPAGDAAAPIEVGTLWGSHFTTLAPVGDETTRPGDYSGARISVLAGPPGDERLLLGSGTSGGRFSVPNVPPGKVTLVVESGNYFEILSTESRDVDFGSRWFRRGSVEYSSPGTKLKIHADGLDPWTDESDLLLVVPTVDDYGTSLAWTGVNSPRRGSTTADGVVLHCSYYCPKLEPERDRDVFLVQESAQRTPGLWILKRGPALKLDPAALQDGRTSTITGTFGDLGPLRRLEVAWQLDEIVPALGPLPVDAEVRGHVSVWAVPDYETHGAYGGFYLAYLVGDSSVRALEGTVEYSQPFGPSWAEYYRFSFSSLRSFTAEGASFDLELASSVSGHAQLDGEGRLSPAIVLSVPLDLRAGGQPAHERVEGVGLVPLIEWSAPEIGTPDGYMVNVLVLVNWDGWTSLAHRATLTTAERQVRLPRGVLIAGREHVLEVTAISGRGAELTRAPYRDAPGTMRAQALSGVIVP